MALDQSHGITVPRVLAAVLLTDMVFAFVVSSPSKVLACNVHWVWNVPCKGLYALFVSGVTAAIVIVLGALLFAVIIAGGRAASSSREFALSGGRSPK